jgi:hypothetical protein
MEGGGLIPVVWPILEANMGTIAIIISILGSLYGYARTFETRFNDGFGEVKADSKAQAEEFRAKFSKVQADSKAQALEFRAKFSEVQADSKAQAQEFRADSKALSDKLNSILIMGAVLLTAYAVTSAQALLVARPS